MLFLLSFSLLSSYSRATLCSCAADPHTGTRWDYPPTVASVPLRAPPNSRPKAPLKSQKVASVSGHSMAETHEVCRRAAVCAEKEGAFPEEPGGHLIDWSDVGSLSPAVEVSAPRRLTCQ